MSDNKESKSLSDKIKSYKDIVSLWLKSKFKNAASWISSFIKIKASKILGAAALKWTGKAVLKALNILYYPAYYLLKKYGLKLWNEIIYPYLFRLAYMWEKKKVDQVLMKEYEELKKQGFTDEEIKKKRDDMLNGVSGK